MDLLERIRATGLLPHDAPVVVLLSGGRDSVCLLDVAARTAGAPQVLALHVNYGLRAEADADEELCRSLCARLGVALEVRRARRPAGPGNLQAWAREVRYTAGAELARRSDAPLATGHTASDQAETVLYRLASSPSRRALLGMAAETTAGAGDATCRLVRPLLGVTREETAAHCRARGLPWAEDAGNESEAFARGRVRTALLPALDAIHPGAQRNVVRAAQLLREETAVLDELVDRALGGGERIALDDLRILPPALARLVVRRLAEAAVGRLCPRASARLEDVLELADHARLDLGDGARAVVSGGVLHVERTPRLGAATH